MSDADVEEEGSIDISPIPVSINNIEKILQQMKKCVCKIKKEKQKGSGFFATFPYKSTFKNVLITNEHILNKDDLKVGKILKVSINNEEEYKEIEMDGKRLILVNEEKDLTIIEIRKKDKINNYLEIDERYNLNNIEERYKNESLYVLNYPKGKDIVVSYGLLNKMENEDIYHLCSTEGGSSGSPILSLDSLKLIGIHRGFSKPNKCNIGLFIRYAIDEFNKTEKSTLKKEDNKLNENSINEIKINPSINSNYHNKYDIMNYNSEIKKLHQMVAYFYGNFSKERFLKYSNIIKELFQKNKEFKELADRDIFAISLFEEYFEYDKIISEVIDNGWQFYMNLNKYLMNPKIENKDYESIAYFTSEFMYCLDSYAINNNMYLRKEMTLYRGLTLDYDNLILYEKSKGKIILIPAFSSCSQLYNIAEYFTRENTKSKFSVMFNIKVNHKENWLSNGINIQKISKFKSDWEIIIQAFSFFYARNVQIDVNKKTAEIYLESIGRKEILEKKIKNGKDIEYNEIENIM